MTSGIAGWASAHYPRLPAVTAGARGAVLFEGLLRATTRPIVIVPAFICPEVPLVVKRAGKRLILVDVRRETMHMNPEIVRELLSRHDPRDVLLLVDHTFGYPDPLAARARLEHPGLTVIEDCVRGLGAELNGLAVGSQADWALFSMYKTTLGNDEGAVLLGPDPVAESTTVRPVTLRQVVSALSLPRAIYRWIQRYTTRIDEVVTGRDEPAWSAIHGLPNQLTTRRFERQLAMLEDDKRRRELAFRVITSALGRFTHIDLVKPAEHCSPAAYYLSFVFKAAGARDGFVNAMIRHGLPVIWAWNSVPAHYRCFSGDLYGGSSESEYLAGHVCHIPLAEYLSNGRQQRLIALLAQSQTNADR